MDRNILLFIISGACSIFSALGFVFFKKNMNSRRKKSTNIFQELTFQENKDQTGERSEETSTTVTRTWWPISIALGGIVFGEILGHQMLC